MEMKTIITVVITGMLGALVFGVMLPVFAETTSADTTFTNEGYYNLSKIDDNTNTTIFWDHTHPYQLTVNDVVVSLNDVPDFQSVTIYGSDKLVLRYEDRGDAGLVMQCFNDNSYYAVSILSGVDMTVNVSGYTFSGTFGDSVTGDITSTSGYIIDPNGDYVMKNKDKIAYILSNSDMALSGVTTWNDVRLGIYADGSINDLSLTEIYSQSITDLTIGPVSVDSNKNNSFNDLYTIKDVKFSVNTDGTSHDITYSYFIVPYEVTAEKTNHPDGPTTALMNLLPILIGIGLVVGIAGVVLVRRF